MEPHGSGLPPSRLWLAYERYPYVLAKLVTYALVGFGLFFVLRAVENVLAPVFLALLLAYLLDPAVDWFEARGFSRTVGILLFLVLGALLVATFVLFLYPTVAHLLSRITDGVPALIALLETRTLPWLEARLGREMPASLDAVLAEYGETLQAQLPSVLHGVTSTLGDVWTRTGLVLSSLLNAVLIPVLTFYFLRDFDRMRLAAVEYLPVHNRAWLLDRIQAMDVVVGAWFRGQLEVAAILGLMYALGLGAVFGVSGIGFTSGVAIGLLGGLLNVIPYFGFLTAFVLSVLLALLDWSGWMPLVGVLAVFAIVQGLEGYVVTPRIVGEKVGLSPPVVIIALLLGGELLGLLGVLLALPLAGIVRVLLPDLVGWYRATELYTGPVDEQEGSP